MSDAFTKATASESPEDFDIDAWLTGASLPERTVTVYGDGKGYADLQDMIDEFDALRRADAAIREEDESLDHGAAALRLAEQIDAKREAIAASRLTLRFRAVIADESKAIAAKHKNDDDAVTYATLATQSVRPKLSAEHFKAIRSRIGEGQFQAILQAAAEASYGRKVEVPFSLAASALRETQGSSSS